MNYSKLFLTTAALSMLTIFSGCLSTQNLADKAAEKATEVAMEKVSEETGLDVDIDGGSTTITKQDGTSVSVGDGAKIPSDWPSDVPFPEDITVSTAGYYDGSYNIVFGSSDTPDTIASFYEAELTSGGWTQDSENVLAGYYNYEYSNGARTLNLLIVQNDEQTVVTLSITK